MNTPKIILYKHKTYKDGTHPVIFQVIKHGKPIRKVLGRCKPADWLDSKNRVSTKDINSYRINEAIETALRTYGVTIKYPFKEFLQQQIDNFKDSQQVSRYQANQSLLTQITEFSPNIDFDQLDETFILKFSNWLSNEHNNKPNTVRAKMQVLGRVLKIAKKNRIIFENPMEDMTFSKEKVIKSKMNLDEMKRWINSDFTGIKAEVRDLFVATIYLRGIRISDILLLSKKNMVDGRMIYRELKTGNVHDVAIRPELQLIIDKWAGKNEHGYLFSFLDLPVKSQKDKFEQKKQLMAARAKVTRYLKIVASTLGIEKNISPHTARHSFSKLANSVIKNTTITKDLVGHSTLAIHEGYISDISDNEELDSHADSVLDNLKQNPKDTTL